MSQVGISGNFSSTWLIDYTCTVANIYFKASSFGWYMTDVQELLVLKVVKTNEAGHCY